MTSTALNNGGPGGGFGSIAWGNMGGSEGKEWTSVKCWGSSVRLSVEGCVNPDEDGRGPTGGMVNV